MRRDDRGVPRGARAVVGGLLPPRAAALSRCARPGRRRGDRRRPHGDLAAVPAAAAARSTPRRGGTVACRSRAFWRRLLLRSSMSHVRFSRLPVGPHRRGSRLCGEPGGCLPARGHRDRNLPLRVRRARAAGRGATRRISTRSTTKSSVPPDASASPPARRSPSASCAVVASRSGPLPTPTMCISR